MERFADPLLGGSKIIRIEEELSWSKVVLVSPQGYRSTKTMAGSLNLTEAWLNRVVLDAHGVEPLV